MAILKPNLAESPLWFIQLDISGFLRITQCLSPSQIGCYMLLRCYLTTNQKLPKDPKQLQIICKGALHSDIKIATQMFDSVNGDILDIQLNELKERVLKKSNIRSRAGKKGAEARWRKKPPSLTEAAEGS